MQKIQTLFYLLAVALITPLALSDDIELYVVGQSLGAANRPQVLVIFDNSGSMTATSTIKEPFDPNIEYPAVDSDNSLSDRFLYFTRGFSGESSVPNPGTGPGQRLRFSEIANHCAASIPVLVAQGTYTGFIREYVHNRNLWSEIPENNGGNVVGIDCFEDITNNDPGNVNIADGFPVDGLGGNSQNNSQPYTTDATLSNTNFGFGVPVTLFSDNYIRWFHGTTIGVTVKTRLQIAKDVMTDLINTNMAVDFGLMVFNFNGLSEETLDGGRVIRRITQMDDLDRNTFISTINGLTATTFTPLCETLYEAFRYFSGQSVLYGDDELSASPPRDLQAELSGNYLSPLTECNNNVYVILMTDGEPTLDTAANSLIQQLPEIGLPTAVPAFSPTDPISGTEDNYLPSLAEWLNTHDIDGNEDNGFQRISTYTIGFGDEAITEAGALLADTALRGGGRFFTATSQIELSSAFQSALTQILKVNTTFTSPSIASSNFDRTRSLDSVYFAMFLPDAGPRWTGNLKKLTVSGGALVDANGAPAIDMATGNISVNAVSFWGDNSPDGNDVELGGASAVLFGQTPISRNILTDVGQLSNGGTLTSFTKSALIASTGITAEQWVDTLGLRASPETINQDFDADLETLIQWARGVDVDDENQDLSRTDTRQHIMADPIHSKPLAVNYGKRDGINIDVRILVGTNGGFMHMFNDADGSEDWAFIPAQLLPNLQPLRINTSSPVHIYGLDGPPVVHIIDAADDGVISGAADKVWLYFGMRRGGRSYYALDISNPDIPKFKWQIDNNTPGFENLGQTWSKPVISTIPGYTDSGGTAKPVLIFGGGYDPNKDIANVVGSNDVMGTSVYIVDADTGNLVWSISPGLSSTSNLQFTELTDSIPGQVAILDGNGDGITDRLYVGDTGGNIWRIDMPGFSLPNATTNPWTIYKLAQLGGDTTAADHRFFAEISVAKTQFTEVTTTSVQGSTTPIVNFLTVPFEAVLIGSGNRSHPNSVLTSDSFFMVQDRDIKTVAHLNINNSVSSTPFTHKPIPPAILETDLFNVISVTDSQLEDTIAKSGDRGWKLPLTAPGEKSLSGSIVLDGVVFFPTFIPGEGESDALCTPKTGSGRLYAVNLQHAASVFNWRYLDLGDRLPDTPVPHFGVDEEGQSLIRLLGVGVGEPSDDCGTGMLCTQSGLFAKGTYFYKQQY